MDNYVDSLTRYKLQRQFKKAQKQAIKQITPQVGEKAAKRLVKVAAKRLNSKGTNDEGATTNDRADISNTDSTQPSEKGFY